MFSPTSSIPSDFSPTSSTPNSICTTTTPHNPQNPDKTIKFKTQKHYSSSPCTIDSCVPGFPCISCTNNPIDLSSGKKQLSSATSTRVLLPPKQDIRYVRGAKGNQLMVPAHLYDLNGKPIALVSALLDSGCTGSCINQKFVDLHGLETRKLPYPIPVYNADGTVNRDGSIKEFVKIRIKIQEHEEYIDLAVTNLGDTDLYLGYEWLIRHNPTVDWIQRSITFDNCPEECGYKIRDRKSTRLNSSHSGESRMPSSA